MVPRKSFRVAVSYFRPCSGAGGAYTLYPSCCRRWTTPFQLPESAHAPCSSTIVGLGPAAARLGEAEAIWAVAANRPATARTAASRPKRSLVSRAASGNFIESLLRGRNGPGGVGYGCAA